MSEIIISRFESDNLRPISELTGSEYAGREIADENYLRWEYISNPDGRSIMHVAGSDGKIVAQYAILPRRFNHAGKIIKGSLSVNTVTHAGFRGKNLFNQLAEKTFEEASHQGILFTIGFPNPVSLPVIRKKNIFSIIGTLSVMFRVLNPIKSVYNYFKEKGNKSGEEIALSTNSLARNNVEYFDVGTSSAAFNNLIGRFNGQGRFTSHRDANYLSWRYVDIPRRKYYALKHEDKEMNAVIIFRAKYIYGIRCLIVVDIISVNQNAVCELLKAVNDIAKVNGIDLIITALPSHSTEYSAVKSNGFFSVPGSILPQKLAFIIRKHRDDCPPDVMKFEHWFLTFGDYDIF